MLIECKYYGKKVGVDDVAEFAFKIDDIGAHKGVLVTTRGFQKGVFKIARGAGIALVRVDEIGELDVNISNLGDPLHLDGIADEYTGDQTEGNERPAVARIDSYVSDDHTPELSWSVTYDVGNGIEDGSFSEFIDPALDRVKYDRERADEEFRRGESG